MRFFNLVSRMVYGTPVVVTRNMLRQSVHRQKTNINPIRRLTTNTVEARGLSKIYANKVILEDASITLKAKDRAILFGPNGSGKSTIAKILSGHIEPDSGEIQYAANCVVGYLPQDIDDFAREHSIENIRDFLLTYNPQLKKIWKKISTLVYTNDKQVSELKRKFNMEGGYKLTQVLNGLGLTHLDLEQDFNVLSGGEKCRVALAGLILQNPTLLILDEPTNHLDIEAQKWIRHYLKRYPHALLTITHDRSFMNEIGNIMLMVDTDNKSIIPFYGSYLGFINKIKLQKASEMSEISKEQKKIDDLKKELQRLQKKSSLTQRYVYSDAKRITKLTKRIKEFKVNQTESKLILKIPHFEFDEESYQRKNSSTETIEIPNLRVVYNDNCIVETKPMYIARGEKILISGKNGAGKSSLLSLVAQHYETNQQGPFDSITVGYLPQDLSDFDTSMTVIDAFRTKLNISESKAMKYLSRCCLLNYDDFNKEVCELSMGQQRRLQIARLMVKKPDLLILDEPTNHLDVISVEALESALSQFKGTIIAVSHDTWFQKIMNKKWFIIDGKLETESGIDNTASINSFKIN